MYMGLKLILALFLLMFTIRTKIDVNEHDRKSYLKFDKQITTIIFILFFRVSVIKRKV